MNVVLVVDVVGLAPSAAAPHLEGLEKREWRGIKR